MTYESTTAGPAWSCAAAPVRTNTPPPTTPPTPRRRRSNAPRTFFIERSVVDSASAEVLRRTARDARRAAAARTLTEEPDDSMPRADSHPKRAPRVPPNAEATNDGAVPTTARGAAKCILRRAAR